MVRIARRRDEDETIRPSRLPVGVAGCTPDRRDDSGHPKSVAGSWVAVVVAAYAVRSVLVQRKWSELGRCGTHFSLFS